MLVVQDHMLPAEYVAVMRKSMLSACPVSSYSQVSGLPLPNSGPRAKAAAQSMVCMAFSRG